MNTSEILEIISRGEDSSHQLKANITNEKSLAQEMIAFANSDGGVLLIGVHDDGTMAGLDSGDMRRLNMLISNASSSNVRPSIDPKTENIRLSDGLVMIVTIAKGLNKPYMDNDGVIWVKSGADKRKATSREELQRLFQASGLIHSDEILVPGMTLADLDVRYFTGFYEKEYGESLDELDFSLEQLLENMNLIREATLNRGGALLFGKNPSSKLPAFIVKAVAYPGTDVDVGHYLDSQDITGKLCDQYQGAMSFILRNLKHIQREKGVNSLGDPEIPKIVLEELLVNAIIHRDYFVSAPIRIFIFSDRVDIISPGHLPNNLTVENVKRGNSNIRNPVLASFATKILPYRGLGSGIRRALKVYPNIELVDDRDGNLFKVVIARE